MASGLNTMNELLTPEKCDKCPELQVENYGAIEHNKCIDCMEQEAEFKSKYELVDANDPVLREEIPPFDFKNPPVDPIQLARDLTEHMLYHNGIGLSAVQLGIRHRCFVVRSNPVLAVFNPIIVDATYQDEIELEEGCLSFPNLFFKVSRPKAIRVRYTEPNGNVVNKKFIGITARIFQHELDHLDGVLFIDRISKLKLDMALKKAKKHHREYDFSNINISELDLMNEGKGSESPSRE